MMVCYALCASGDVISKSIREGFIIIMELEQWMYNNVV